VTIRSKPSTPKYRDNWDSIFSGGFDMESLPHDKIRFDIPSRTYIGRIENRGLLHKLQELFPNKITSAVTQGDCQSYAKTPEIVTSIDFLDGSEITIHTPFGDSDFRYMEISNLFDKHREDVVKRVTETIELYQKVAK